MKSVPDPLVQPRPNDLDRARKQVLKSGCKSLPKKDLKLDTKPSPTPPPALHSTARKCMLCSVWQSLFQQVVARAFRD